MNGRNKLFKYLLGKGYRVSSWYPSVDIFFHLRKDKPVKTPNSDWVGNHIVNIWVNDEVDDNYLYNISQDILKFKSGVSISE